MGSNYKTAKPTFVEDFMYTPPWELYKEVIQKKDKEIDDGISTTSGLSQALDFKYLDFDKTKADEKKLLYTEKINNLVEKLKKDPENYTKYSQEIGSLQRDMYQDFTSGDISTITGDYNKYQDFVKQHEKYRQKNASRYSIGEAAFYEQARDRRTKNGYDTSAWSSENLMETLDIRDGFAKFVKAKKPNVTAYANSGAAGGMIFKKDGTNESLSADELEDMMKLYISTTPNIGEYLAQSQRIGSEENLEGLIGLARSLAYSKETAKSSSSRDPLAVAEFRARAQRDLATYKHSLKEQEQLNLMGGLDETRPAGEVLGVHAHSLLKNAGLLQDGVNPNNQVVNFGFRDLYNKGVVKSITALEKLKLNVNSYTKSTADKTGTEEGKKLGGLGNVTLGITLKKPMKYRGRTLKPGEVVFMTASMARRNGLIDSVVENSGQPMYLTDGTQGIKYSFRSNRPGSSKTNQAIGTQKSTNSTIEEDIVEAMVYPSGSFNGAVKNGLQFIHPDTIEY